MPPALKRLPLRERVRLQLRKPEVSSRHSSTTSTSSWSRSAIFSLLIGSIVCILVLSRTGNNSVSSLFAWEGLLFTYPSQVRGSLTSGLNQDAVGTNASASSGSSGSSVTTIAAQPKIYVPGSRTLFTTSDGDSVEFYTPALSSASHLEGVVLLAHGCKTRASVWWPPDAKDCSNCQGMPVERELVLQLVSSGYLPLSMAPFANRRSSQCWADSDKNVVLDVVTRVYSSLNISQATPFYALGIANGAIFVERMACSSLIARGGRNISAIAMLNGGIWHGVDDKVFPPTLFLCMARNADLCTHNNRTISKMVAARPGTAVKQVVLEPRPLNRSYFHDVGRVLSTADSSLLFDKLWDAQLLWPGSGIFIEDPLFGSYAATIRKLVATTLPNYIHSVDSFKYPNSPLAQLFSLSWGFKETTEEGMPDVVRWFKKWR